MKRLALLLITLIAAISLSAQTSENIIYQCARGEITYMEPVHEETAGQTAAKVISAVLEASFGSSTVSADHPEYADAIANAIAGAIGRSYRVRVIDGQLLPEDLADGKPALYFDGSISSIKTRDRIHEVTDSDGKKHDEREYLANVNATINIKDAHTDVIVNTINISSSTWSESWWTSTDKAMAYVIDELSNYVTKCVNKAFPLYASILEGAQYRKDRQKEVYIDLGTDLGIPNGMTFIVYQQQTIAGKEAKKEVGKLRVKEVLGPELSLCRVTRGGKDIKSLLDDNATLVITSLLY